jgi:hypothetical protein
MNLVSGALVLLARFALAAVLALGLVALALYALVNREASSGEKRQQAERSLAE